MADLPSCSVIDDATISTTGYSNGPHYNKAVQKISSFAASGSWTDADCAGLTWMQNTCNTPP